MEVATILTLAGLGYLVTQGTKPVKKPRKPEGFQSYAYPSPPTSALSQTPSGGSPQSSPSQLDQQFQTVYGKTYPSQPNPATASGMIPTDYGRTAPQFVNLASTPAMEPNQESANARMFMPVPQSPDAVRPSVAMNSPGIEKNPNYLSGDTVISPLSGQSMSTKDFTHNNMQPFYGGRVKQNMNIDTNTSILDSFTGAGSTQIKKQEVESMFDSNKSPFGNPFGMEDNTDFFQSRMEDPAMRRRDGERPFEPVKVGAGIGEKFGSTGKGGFQQYEVNEQMINNIRRTDDLRTADNPKLSYKGTVISGQQFVGKSMENPGEVRKYKPDGFFVDQEGERFIGAFSEESQRESVRPVQVMPYTTRADTTTEIIGPAASQEFGENYVTGSYRTPMHQQFGGAGMRNADMSTYTSANTDAPENDYGRSGYEVRPNERYYTTDRVVGLNVTPADNGAHTVHYSDDSRPTRREETSGNIRQTGTPVGYAGGAPAITVWDPTDVARTTVKETTVKWDYRGIAAPADGPTRLTVYDPDDIARPTQKHQISAKSEYYGGVKAATEKFTSHQSAYNMRLNPSKEAVRKLPKPFAGNGGIGTFNSNVKQTSKKLDTDIIDDRALAVNNVVGLPPGAGDIGQVKYRAPLKLDISMERNMPVIVDAVNRNPLQQSLQRNAEHDEALLAQYLNARA
jgi:hypothetical protein